MSSTLELAKQLIAQPSITPSDADCQKILAKRLEQMGFIVEHLPFGDVSNLWARKGTEGPLLVFAGHTDVVPPGDLSLWESDPFKPEVRNNYLYGRGAADMKSSIAAMIVATENFLQHVPEHQGSIGFLITSDEEGDAVNGTRKVVEHLRNRGEAITYCLVGEASSENILGDMIKIGRRGSLSGELKILGVQGHIAYPQKANNPVHKAIPALHELIATHWDEGNAEFDATSLQISNIHAGTGAKNVIPGTLEISFNLRYSNNSTAEHLQNQIIKLLDKYQLKYEISWQCSAQPFLTKKGKLVALAEEICQEICHLRPQLSTTGGTSDARFIIATGCEIIELGPPNQTIHKVNECIMLSDLERLAEIYQKFLFYLIA